MKTQHTSARALRAVCVTAACCVLGACGSSNSSRGLPDEIVYNWHVRPILSENCFKCHGPDAEAREADLRLDVGELAVQRLEGPRPRFAIVPGDPDASELIRRINSADPEERMPPEAEHKVLTARDKLILRRWIADGAQYQPHWAFIKPTRPVPPRNGFSDRVVNPIDAFVFRRLELEGLVPSPEADRETLINRVSLTLTGLPPTLEEVDRFVADPDPQAYEHLVDRLLASPRYAEHMTAYWLDLARWSESDGYLDDHHDRYLWPYRDWVIDAFARNRPYDEFGTWQLAGDLLPGATREQILATAFLRIGKRTTENGAIDAEYQAETMIERTDNALGIAFMGLTLGCARCHDHKYDPITQHAYYSLGAFFNTHDEPGVYAPGYSGIQGGPTLPWADAKAQAEVERRETAVEQAQARYIATREAAAREAGLQAERLLSGPRSSLRARLTEVLAGALAAHYAFETATQVAASELPAPRPERPPPASIVEFDAATSPAALARRTEEQRQAARSEQAGRAEAALQAAFATRVPRNYVPEALTLSPATTAGVAAAVIQDPVFTDGVVGRALEFNSTNKGFLGRDLGWYDRTEPFSIDFWFRAADTYDNVPVVSHRSEQNAGHTGWELTIEGGHLRARLAHSPPANMIQLTSVEPFPIGRWVHVTLTYDGSSRAAGTHVYVDGQLLPTRVDHDTLTRSMLPWTTGDQLEPFLGATIGTRFRAKAPVGAALDELRFFGKALRPLEVAYLHDPDAALERGDALRGDLVDVLVDADASVAAAQSELTAAREVLNTLVTAIPQVLVMGEAPEPRTTHVLHRGLYSAPGEAVTPRGLESVFAWDDSLPANRLGLAQWLFDADHPLTARVFVNRLWQLHFGRGLVSTSEDFGSQGSIPTHPELLDWLAAEFVESGWDIKALHRLIVTSATYRQSSDLSDALLARDAPNALLARGPRWRMTAEMVRDGALAASGLLGEAVGGKSARPYQPAGIWNPLNSFYSYPEPDAVPADEHHRRTLYTFVKRNAPHPELGIFDFTSRTESVARRRTSNTPLQALTLMNDPQFVEAYRGLATRVLTLDGDDEERLRRLYRLATRQSPEAAHIEILRDYYAEQRAVYTASAEKTQHLLDIGVTPADPRLDPVEFAAMTNVAALVMNSPDAYTVR
jgi:Protein of unknown function (DUF1553)/Protein of unknown function (DUF1549)/Concanavalin A-like lectin/glucanases superfamily/Planctomycete cytochrome C